MQLLRLDGQEAESESLAREAYESSKALLGEMHPDTRLVSSTLGLVLAYLGQFDEAEKVLRSVHTAATAAEGGDGAAAAAAADAADGVSAAEDGGDAGKLDEAIPVSLELQVVASNLVHVLIAQRRLRDAVPFAREAMHASKTLLGAHHETTLDELARAGPLLEEVGELDEAEAVMRAELGALRHIHGDASPKTLLALSRLGRLLGSREDASSLREAEGLMREDLDSSRTALGEGHVDTLAALSNLAQLLCKRGKHAVALPLAKEGLAASERLFGHAHAHTRLMQSLCSHVEHELHGATRGCRRARAIEASERSRHTAAALDWRLLDCKLLEVTGGIRIQM